MSGRRTGRFTRSACRKELRQCEQPGVASATIIHEKTRYFVNPPFQAEMSEIARSPVFCSCKLSFMRQILSMAVVALSAVAIASGQQQGAGRDPKTVVEQVIRKLDNE